MSSSVVIKISDEEWKKFDAPAEVKQYIRQLESFIMHPGTSKLREFYKERFGDVPDLAKELKTDLELLTAFCKDCNFKTAKCQCRISLRVDVLSLLVAHANSSPLLSDEIKQDLCFMEETDG